MSPARLNPESRTLSNQSSSRFCKADVEGLAMFWSRVLHGMLLHDHLYVGPIGLATCGLLQDKNELGSCIMQEGAAGGLQQTTLLLATEADSGVRTTSSEQIDR